MNWGKVAQFSDTGANGMEKLAELRFLNIKIAALGSHAVRESRIRLLPELPFDYPAAVRQGKYFADTSPKKGSRLSSRRWRRVNRQPRDNPLQLNIDFLVLATGYSLGIIGSRFSAGCTRKRIRVKDFSLGRTGRKVHRRAMKGKKYEPYLIAYDAGDAFSKQRYKRMSRSYDGDQSEDRQSEEVQSAYKRENEVDEETEVRANFGLHHTEEQGEQNEETDWSWVLQDKDGDPLAESISSLQTTQEVLENEVQKLSDLVKDSEAEESTCGNDGQDVIVLPHGRVDVFEMNEKMQHLEQKLKEASGTIRQKDLRISNLEIAIDDAHRPLLEEDAANIVQLEMEVERQLQDKIQAEIQWLVMVKAKQNWQVRAEDRIALEEHKSSAGDSTKMMLKLRDTESKIVMLKEQVDKLELHEKELYRTTEVLKMQSRTFKVSLFGLVQLIMLCLSLKIFFGEVSVPFSDVVPT
ncbi:hypothetical protein PR202_ga19987 [Eleusine coracana subsp. coracana]|uniref:Uncharacterized protein n=1 Tax=Eleusine coracana subsp. coracana TaxID=191504 RepID=A0AAV5CXJ2_ELECO|nr:hypothetical protein PR202_ga19987 [Eleusine coracana subsp. coracana]